MLYIHSETDTLWETGTLAGTHTGSPARGASAKANERATWPDRPPPTPSRAPRRLPTTPGGGTTSVALAGGEGGPITVLGKALSSVGCRRLAREWGGGDRGCAPARHHDAMRALGTGRMPPADHRTESGEQHGSHGADGRDGRDGVQYLTSPEVAQWLG